jgi:hypothetical protein
MTNLAKGGGTALTTTVNSMAGGSGLWNIALARQDIDRYPGLTKESDGPDFDSLDAALADGVAFAEGGARIGLRIESRVSEPVGIINVRPVNMRTMCLPDGLLVRYGNQGGEFVALSFDLEAARPAAFGREEKDGTVTEPKLYFQNDAEIRVPAGDPLTMDLDFDASVHAFAFDIEITYVVSGVKSTQIVSGAKGQFRAAASTCPTPDAFLALGDAQKSYLKTHRYHKVMRRVSDDSTQRITSVPPDQADSQCEAWR